MDSIRSMQTFVRAIELGSLSAVAREQHTTQPTVSKVVAALEKGLGVRLLERSTTRLVPTEQGKRFYDRARGVLEEFNEAVADARGQTERPTGLLRVSAPVSIGVLWLNRLVQEFLASHPEIEVELILNDRFVDLVEEGMDVALRLGGTLPPNVVARRVATSPRWLVAAPTYLAAQPRIRQPADVPAHNYLRFAWASDTVELHGPRQQRVAVKVHGRYRINNSLCIRDAFLMGRGLGLAPGWLVQDLIDAGQLVRVLPQWQGTPHEAVVLYPTRRYQALRARLFLQFLSERLPQLPGFQPVS